MCDRCGSTLSHAYNLSRHYQTKKCIKFSAEPGAAPAGKQPIAAAAANNQNSLKDCTSKKPCPHCMKNIFKSNMARHLKSCKVYLSKGIDIPLTPSNRSGNTDVANPVSPPPEHSADGNIVTAETMEHCSQQVLHANDDKPDQDLPNNKLYLPRSSLAWAKADQQLEQHIKRHFPLSKIKNADPDESLGQLTSFLRFFFTDYTALDAVPKRQSTKPRQSRCLTELYMERRALRKQYRARDQLDEHVVEILRKDYNRVQKDIKKLRKIIKTHEQDREAQKQRSAFLRDPHKFAKRLSRKGTPANPEFSEQTCFDYFSKLYEDPERGQTFSLPDFSPATSKPSTPLTDGSPTWTLFQNTLRKCRNKSAPGKQYSVHNLETMQMPAQYPFQHLRNSLEDWCHPAILAVRLRYTNC